MSVRGKRGLRSPSEHSMSSGGSAPIIDLVRLQSARKHLDLGDEFVLPELRRKDFSEEDRLWERIQPLAEAAAEEIMKRDRVVPDIVIDVANLKYAATANKGWFARAIAEFESTELKTLMPTWSGKGLNVASSSAFLQKLTGVKGEPNPAIILQELKLWDKDRGSQMAIPIELLDRSLKREDKQEDSDFKVSVHLLALGVMAYLLWHLDIGNKEIKLKAEIKRAVALDSVSNYLESARSSTKKVVSVRNQKKATRGEFTAPRKPLQRSQAEVSVAEEYVARPRTPKKQNSQEAAIAALQEENRRLQEQVLELLALRKGEAAATERRSSAFGKLAAIKMSVPEEGKIVDNAINFDKIDALLEEEKSVFSGLTELESSSSIEKEKERKGVDSRHRRILYDACKLSLSKVPGSLSKQSGKWDKSGIYIVDSQGNLFLGKQTAKSKSTYAWDHQFSFVLVEPLWSSKEEIDSDEGEYITIRWAQNWPQMKLFFEEQEELLQRDLEFRDNLVRANKYYNTQNRLVTIKKFFKDVVKVIARAALGPDPESPTSKRHVQVFALISHFVYLMWTSALVLNQDSLLLEDPIGLWNRHFEPKLRTAMGGVGVGMKVAAVWLGYGCQGKCQKSGMCPNFCLNCNSEEVAAAMGRYHEKSESNGSLKARYAAWKAETIAQNSSADTAWKVFLKNTPKPKGGSKNEGKVKEQISQEDYYNWLEENQSVFKLAIPDF
jgi:hypothetical protein